MTVEFIDPRGEPAIEPLAYELSVALEPGTRVVLLGTSSPWIEVRYEDQDGWIPTDALM